MIFFYVNHETENRMEFEMNGTVTSEEICIWYRFYHRAVELRTFFVLSPLML